MCVSQLLFSFLDPLIISRAQICQICLGRSLTASLENHETELPNGNVLLPNQFISINFIINYYFKMQDFNL